MWAIVPLKGFEAAKQRLSRVLSARERRELMLAMARDVLTALCRSKRLAGVLIVSRSPEADALAQAFTTERFAESPDADLPAALTQASAHLTEHFHARGVVVVPADVPLIDPDELDELLAGHESVTVVPDATNTGTNCLILSPPDVIGFVFDGKSFRPHVDAAFARGLTPRVVPARSFALDIDTAADLRELLRVGRETQTGSFLARSGIARRLQDADNGEPRMTT